MALRPFRTVLIANRGEIALRVIRTCRAQGLRTVAIYSDVDRPALHVRAADLAYRVGGSAAADSYLCVDAIVDVARRTQTEAVHPGYGFLAENPAFAHACEQAGLTFVGPPVSALAACGDKARTRQVVRAAGVPVLPGTDPVDDVAARAAADGIGFPILLKAVAGGGGKGIHLVHRAADLPGALRLARGEAYAAFGDDRVYLERWVPDPRHVEVQIIADAHGTVLHLGERECSIRRRHQKMIEEAPSPALSQDIREEIYRAAVTAARAVGYQNAGTIEFLVSGRAFYFLEINARLQVEHPVTELLTGVDVVGLQLAVAAGHPLPLRQEDVALRGHALECRISAEDPDSEFLPWVGRITDVVLPGGPGIRIDGALVPGMEVTRFYDPLLAKVLASGATREEAVARMSGALREMIVTGVPTTLPFHMWAMSHPAFLSGVYTTRFVTSEWPRRVHRHRPAAVAAAAALAYREEREVPVLPPQGPTAWGRAGRLEGVSE
jgi:acetyl-CoA carboxylase biotin carboxylase subunit